LPRQWPCKHRRGRPSRFDASNPDESSRRYGSPITAKAICDTADTIERCHPRDGIAARPRYAQTRLRPAQGLAAHGCVSERDAATGSTPLERHRRNPYFSGSKCVPEICAGTVDPSASPPQTNRISPNFRMPPDIGVGEGELKPRATLVESDQRRPIGKGARPNPPHLRDRVEAVAGTPVDLRSRPGPEAQ
jgi:hypothetical protein